MPALLATERNQFLRVALLAAPAQKTFFQSPALQVGLELLLNVRWKRPADFCAQFTK